MSAAPVPIQLKEGEELFRLLSVAVSDYRVFSAKHPRFLDSCQNFLTALEAFFAAHPEQRNVLFVQSKGRVFFRKVPMAVLSPPAIRFGALLLEKQVEGLRLGPDSNLSALTCAIEGLWGVAAESEEPPWKQINRLLEKDGLKARVGFFTDAEFSELAEGDEDLRPAEDSDAASSIVALPDLEVPLELYKSTLVALSDLMSMLGTGGNPKFDTLIDITRKFTTGVIEGDQKFLPLASVHYTNEYTFNHSVNVCLLVTAALKPLVKDPEWLVRIGQAALLHDLGKSLVPQELLYREDGLADDEREEIERHCGLGAEILQDSKGIDALSVVVAYEHHRRPNGGGYPKRGRPVDVVTSLVAAADIFEALIAERPYKRGLSPAEAFEIFSRLPEARGLDSAVRLLLDVLSPYPPGTVVRLDTGDYAVVSRVREGVPDKPWVRMISISGGERHISPEELSLTRRRPGCQPPRIVETLGADWWESDPNECAEEEDKLFEFKRRVADGTLLATEG